MTIDIIHQHSNTLPSGFKINFTVGRIVKDEPNSPETATSFSSLNSFSGIGSARETSATPQPGVVDGSTASLAGPASGDSVERHAPNPHSLPDTPPQAADKPHGVSPPTPCGTNPAGEP